MKKFLVFASMFAAAFMMVSCGGGSSSDNGKGYTQDGSKVCTEYEEGDCNGHKVRSCIENENAWYELEDNGKKFECDGMDCLNAGLELRSYCDGNIDYEEGFICSDSTQCPDGSFIKLCVDASNTTGYLEINGKKFEYDPNNPTSFLEAQSAAEKECGEGNEGGESTFATDAEAYLPASYADKTLDAWYMLKDEDDDKIKIEAIFLFNDNTLVVTNSKVYSVEDGREPEKKINAEGTFTITSGDYDNGTADVDAAGMQFEVTITDGVLFAMEEEFIKQDNADAPEPK